MLKSSILADPVNQARCHQPFCVDVWKPFIEGFTAPFAAESTSINVKTNTLAVHGKVANHLLTTAKSFTFNVVTIWTDDYLLLSLGFNMIVVVLFMKLRYRIRRQIKDICWLGFFLADHGFILLFHDYTTLPSSASIKLIRRSLNWSPLNPTALSKILSALSIKLFACRPCKNSEVDTTTTSLGRRLK